MNEAASGYAVPGRLHDDRRTSSAEATLHLYGGVGRSAAAALAGTIAAMIFAGCPTTGGDSSGGPSSLAAVQGARTSQNIVAHQNAQAAMNAQILQDRRALRMEEQAEARRNVQQANQRLEVQRQQQDAARDARRQAEIRTQQQTERQRGMVDRGGGGNPNQGQGNQGQGNGQGNQGQGGGQGRQ